MITSFHLLLRSDSPLTSGVLISKKYNLDRTIPENYDQLMLGWLQTPWINPGRLHWLSASAMLSTCDGSKGLPLSSHGCKLLGEGGPWVSWPLPHLLKWWCLSDPVVYQKDPPVDPLVLGLRAFCGARERTFTLLRSRVLWVVRGQKAELIPQ